MLVSILSGSRTIQASAESVDRLNQKTLPNTICNSIDFVFLVDQTAKMQQVDPHDLRLKAIHWIIMLLGYDHMYRCPESTYRIGVISYGGQSDFGQDYKLDIPLTEISPRLSQGLEAWRREWKDLANKLVEPAPGQPRDLIQAIQQANKLLDTSPDSRKQALIIFNADAGSPCDISNECLPSKAQEIIKGAKTKIPALGENRILQFYAWPDNNSANYEGYAGQTWKTLLHELTPSAAQFIDVDSNVTVSPTYGLTLVKNIFNIFSSFNSDATIWVEEACSVTIPPFVKRAGFLIYKPNEDTNTAIDDPDDATAAITKNSRMVGEMEVSDSPLISPGGNVEPFIIDRPMPGDWKIRGCASSMYVVYFELFAQADGLISDTHTELPQYDNNSNNSPDKLFDPANQYFLKFKLVDDNKIELIEYPDSASPIITGTVIMPDRQEEKLDFKYDESGKFYQSTKALPVRQIGNYSWQVDFQRNAEAEKLTLKGKYNVSEVKPIKLILHLDNPSPTLHGDYLNQNLEVLPVKITAQFVVDSQGKEISIPYRELFTDPNNPDEYSNIDQAINIILTNVETGEQRTGIMKPSITDQTSTIFEGEIGGDLELTGSYVVAVSVESDQIKNKLYRSYSELKDQKQFTRTDTVLTNPLTYQVLLAVLMVILLVILVLLLWIFTNPVSGQLEVYRMGATASTSPVAIFELQSWHLRQRVIKHKELVNKTRLLGHIDRLIIKNSKDAKIDPSIDFTFKFKSDDKVITNKLYQDFGENGTEQPLVSTDQVAKENEQTTQGSAQDNRQTKFNIPGGMYFKYRKD